jgi:hypothetical protein
MVRCNCEGFGLQAFVRPIESPVYDKKQIARCKLPYALVIPSAHAIDRPRRRPTKEVGNVVGSYGWMCRDWAGPIPGAEGTKVVTPISSLHNTEGRAGSYLFRISYPVRS